MRVDELKSGSLVPMLKGTHKRKEWNRDTDIRFPYELTQWLYNHGYKIVGSGGFSRVYINGAQDRVVKVSEHPDSSWLSYAQYCQKNWKGNPHLMRVFALKKYTYWPDKRRKPDVYFIAVLERLKKRKLPQWMENSIIMATANKNLIHGILAGIWGNQLERFRSMYPKFYEMLMSLKKSRPRQSGWDIHSDNVMWRGDVPVLTDPFA